MYTTGCKLKTVVFLGSVRDGRNADRVAKFVVRKLQESGHEVELIDPLKVDIPLLKNPYHFYPDPSAIPKPVFELNKKVLNADAYVIVTPEYNRNMPPALTNLLDHSAPESYAFKTSGIVSYSAGPGAGLTAACQARGIMVEFGAAPIPCLMGIGEVGKALDEEGKPLNDRLDHHVAKFIEQLDWYATALKNHRGKGPTPETGAVPSVPGAMPSVNKR